MTALPPDAAAAAGADEVPATPDPEPQPGAGDSETDADSDADSDSDDEDPGLAPDGEMRPTGVAAADAAAARLAALDDVPVEEHVEIYEDAHRRLQEGLADLDER